MRLLSASSVALGGVALSGFAPTVHAWGAAGHEIIATIAQIHLHPSVLPTICSLLDMEVDPDEDPSVLRSECHISTIATWADKYRMRMRWSAAMHYVGAVDDFPRERCEFPGVEGWAGSRSINVLDAVKNVTKILADWSGVDEHDLQSSVRRRPPIPGPLQEEAFKFLVHFVGDMHQPLHLTGRARGGNSIKVHFGNRLSNLHSVWDTSIPAKLIRTVPRNYTHPLPDFSPTSEPTLTSSYFGLSDDYPGYIPPTSAQIESGLRGTIYDALIRRIMWEGVRGRWARPAKGQPYSEVDTWGACPPNSTVPVFEAPLEFQHNQAAFRFSPPAKTPLPIDPDGPLICPYAWSRPIHTLNCDYIWPEGIQLREEDLEEHTHSHPDDVLVELLEEEIAQDESFYPPRRPHTPPHDQYPDLDVVSYMEPLEKGMIVEKLMAQGGLRLAGILNWLFADWDE